MSTGNAGTNQNKKQVAQAQGALARWSRIAFLVVAAAFAVCVVLQVFIAGMAIFAGPQNWVMHVVFVQYFGWLSLVLLVLSVTGRMGIRLFIESGLLFLLIGYMYFSANVVDTMPLAAATHPVMAIIMFALSLSSLPRAWGLAFPRSTL